VKKTLPKSEPMKKTFLKMQFWRQKTPEDGSIRAEIYVWFYKVFKYVLKNYTVF
jgi:hypothetical protein